MRNRFASLAAGLACVLLATSALAAGPTSTGLGQSWPNTTDVSTSPRYHVYVFQKQGVRYVQVNDASGTVRGAIAYTPAAGVLDLPIGADASRWITSTRDTKLTGALGEQVYRDEIVTITVTPQAGGMAVLRAMSDCPGDPRVCSQQVISQ